MTEQAWKERASRIQAAANVDRDTAEKWAAWIGDIPDIEGDTVIVREYYGAPGPEIARLPVNVLWEESGP